MTDSPAPTAATPRRIQPHHVVYVVLLIVVAVSVYVLFKKSQTNGVNLDNGTIEQLIPAPGSKILSQDEIGIDLAPGYDGELALNGVAIPLDELTVVPQLNKITFKQTPTSETQLIPAQQNCVTATYWPSATGPSQSSTRSWCFSVL